MKTIVLGSCRTIYPCRNINDLIKHNIGYTASLNQMIQAVKIMRGELVIPDDLERYVFRDPSGKDKIVDLSQIEVLVAEVSSLRSQYCIIGDQKIYLRDHSFFNGEVFLEDADISSLNKKLNCFCDFFPGVNILLIPVHYGKNRSLITLGVHRVATKNNYGFFNPCNMIKQFGARKCLQSHNYYHYTEFMGDKIKNKVVEFIEGYSSSSVS